VQFLVSFSNTSDRTNQPHLQIPFFTKNFPLLKNPSNQYWPDFTNGVSALAQYNAKHQFKTSNAFWFGFFPTVFEKLRGLELARDIEKFTESVSLSVHSDFHDRNTSF
jgi:hypothetical protein